ncbi:MAG: hypothetical protein N3B21_00455 [Clostridia bacterium]|nr:hypothetical protein [Clostridia bacterium]
MRFLRLPVVLVSIAILLSGCNEAVSINTGPKKEVTLYTEKLLKVDKSVYLNVTCDSGDIEVYVWDRNEVKFEIIKRIRGVEERALLEERLENFEIEEVYEEDKVTFSSKYKGSIKKPQDIRADIKVLMPRKVLGMNIKLDIGSIKLFDHIKCPLNIEVDMANTIINSFEGKITFESDMGNIRIDNGIIQRGSEITSNMGNIGITASYEENAQYSFETNVGNIDLVIPSDTDISFESIGTVEANDFKDVGFNHPTKLKLRSGMGKISIKKGQ